MSAEAYSVSVRKVGGQYFAHLQVGNQGFDVLPAYDEEEKDGVKFMVDMLKKAVANIVKSALQERTGG